MRTQAELAHGCSILAFVVPLTSCEQLHDDDRSLLFDVELLCASPVLLATAAVVPLPFPFPLSRCECDVLSRALSRRWLLLPRLFDDEMVAGVPGDVATDAFCCDCELPPDCCCCCCCWPCLVLLLTGVVVLLLLSSAEPPRPFCSDLTISCLPSDVFVPGFVRLILIFSPW